MEEKKKQILAKSSEPRLLPLEPNYPYKEIGFSTKSVANNSYIVPLKGWVNFNWDKVPTYDGKVDYVDLFYTIDNYPKIDMTDIQGTPVGGLESSSGGSKRVYMLDIDRGHYIVGGIQVNLSNPYRKSKVQVDAPVYINSLPEKPIASNKMIPSGVKTTTLTVTPGRDPDNDRQGPSWAPDLYHQNLSLYYSSEFESGEKLPFISDSTILNLKYGRYNYFYFWTYDGLEYSPISTQVLIENNWITPGSLVITPVEGSIGDNSSVSENFRPIYATKLSCSFDGFSSSGNAPTYHWYYRTKSLPVNPQPGHKEPIPTGEKEFASGSSNSIEVNALSLNIPTDSWYQIGCAVSDGIETTPITWYGISENDTNIEAEDVFCLLGASDLKFYNTWSNQSVEPKNYFYDKLRIKWTWNFSITDVLAQVDSLEYKKTASQAEKNGAYIDLDTSDYNNFKDGKVYTFILKFTYLGGKTETKRISIQRNPQSNLCQNFNLLGLTTVKPFTSTLQKDVSILNLFGTGTQSDFDKYGISGIDQYRFSLSVPGTNISNIDANILKTSARISGDSIFFTLDFSKLYNIISSIQNQNEAYTVELKISITNNNNRTSVATQNFTVDFRELPIFDSTAPLTITKKSLGGTPPADLLFPGDSLDLKIQFKDYNNGELIYPNIEIYRSAQENNLVGGKWENFIAGNSIQNNKANGKNPGLHSVTITKKIDTIENSSYLFFRAKLTDDNGTTTTNFKKANLRSVALKGEQIDISTDGVVEKNQQKILPAKLKINRYNFSLIGGEKQVIKQVGVYAQIFYHSGDTEFYYDPVLWTTLTNPTPPTDLTKEFVLSSENWDFCELQIQIATTYLNGHTLTTTSPKISIFNAAPTISPRKNHIGINTNDIDDDVDGVIIIQETSGRKYIKLKSIKGLRWIDIETGDMSGFILDGGAW